MDTSNNPTAQPFSIYSSPIVTPACPIFEAQPCSPAERNDPEKENTEPTRPPSAGFQGKWHESPQFSGRTDLFGSSQQTPSGKPGAKQGARKPLRNITPLFARQVCCWTRSTLIRSTFYSIRSVQTRDAPRPAGSATR